MTNVILPLLASVLAPWTPVATNGTNVEVWGRRYAFATNALPVSVTALDRELLAAPVRLIVEGDRGKSVVWTKYGNMFYEAKEESATLCAWQESREVTADVVTTVEYDGLMKISLALVPGPAFNTGRSITKAWLEIPLKKEVATLFQAYPYSPKHVGAVGAGKAFEFCASLWVGNESVGLDWCCESDEAFAPAGRSNAFEIIPQANETVVRIRLVEEEVVLPRTWVFGLQATPVKPFDRTWNRNYVMHGPPMGVGVSKGVKRPEVWWTAQRAFPTGDIDAQLDAAQKAGVKTISFHEDWVPIQNNPASAQADFRAIADKCHARGMKVMVYAGYELSPLDPEWGAHHAEWLSCMTNGIYSGWVWYRPPAQADYRSCLASSYAQTWLSRVKAAYEKFNLDGYYLDGTICARKCANARHGCGWTDAHGSRHYTYPIFAVREVMRELYRFISARGGVISAHQSGYNCSATLAFTHAYWDGEQLACRQGHLGEGIKESLSLEAFRAEFMGRNHGVPAEFLCYETADWSYEDAWALALPHDVLVRPAGFAALPRFLAIWKTLTDFDIASAEFLPYWDKPVRVTPDSVKVSVYRHSDGRALHVISNLSPNRTVDSEVTLLDGSTRRLTLAPFQMKLVNTPATK